MSRCHLNEHAFYELMPVVMRTEHVVLEGNRFFPLEMKIFARQEITFQKIKRSNIAVLDQILNELSILCRQVKECTALRLDTIVLTGCQVSVYTFRRSNHL